MDQTAQLIRKAHDGDKSAREQLVEKNLGLVITVARRFAGRGTETEDLIQIGCIGLLKAIDRFDLGFEVKFSTYAVPMIAGEIRRFLRDDGMLKVSRSMKETAGKAARAREELEHALGREPTLEEISAKTGDSKEEIIFAMESAAEVESLQKPVLEGDGNSIFLADRLVGESNEQEELVTHVMVQEALNALNEEERFLIIMRYYRDQTQTEVAQLMHRTQVQISRMEKRILQKMKTICKR
ncbi:MAG: SigB/SigF/SigG family RNA polymerase sigma factor [Eubacteriales bacterium]|nr:SigB/SigF/SigG family RNA polymerase sigma factor [Eubacteriales bacterium]